MFGRFSWWIHFGLIRDKNDDYIKDTILQDKIIYSYILMTKFKK